MSRSSWAGLGVEDEDAAAFVDIDEEKKQVCRPIK